MTKEQINEKLGHVRAHWRGGSTEKYIDINRITYVTRSNKWYLMQDDGTIWEVWNITTKTVGAICKDDVKPSRWYGLKIKNSEQMLPCVAKKDRRYK